MWNRIVQRGRWRSFALFLSLCGCTSLADCKYELRQKIRTSQAWHEFDGCNDQCFTCDYHDGWKKGYYDVLTGGDGRPPVVPPKRYWKPPVFAEHDPTRQNDWYTGYQDGAACAKTQPDFHYVPTFMAPSVHPHYHGHDVIDVMTPGEQAFSTETAVPMSESTGTQIAPSVEPAPSADPAANPTVDPAAKPETAPPAPKGEDYEKDPEPSSTSFEGVGPTATERLVAVNRRPTSTYLDQLVKNASQGGSPALENGEQ